MNNNRVIVAMSGGVDSSVAAALLKEQGYDVIGITMKTWGFMEVGGAPKHESGCCSLDAIYDAKNVADLLNFPHYTVDFTKSFENTVIENFVEEYLNGRTPNPCVVCNRKIKWEELLKKADSLDAKYVATGHYAQIKYDEKRCRYCLIKSNDDTKDQTYALWGLTQEHLERTLFPLGNLTKIKVRELAKKLNLKTAAKPDSQEICFVVDNNYQRFLKERIPDRINNIPNGDFVYKGKKIGNHKGIPFYTVGQRRGLGVSLGEPVYVTKINYDGNFIELGDKNDLLKKNLEATDLNFVSTDKLRTGDLVVGKIRYNDIGAPAEIIKIEENNIIIKFIEYKSAVTPGQSLVLYDNKGYLLLGGIIKRGF